MAHYYFDVRDGGDLSVDDLGMELRDIEAVEAMRALGDMARDAIRSQEYDASQNAEWQLKLGMEAAPCCTPG